VDHREVARYWNENADAWARLARAGYDTYRDHLNTPAFLGLLPNVKGLAGLDIGCGEGHNTRLLAKRGARMTAIDVAATFIEYARQSEEEGPLGIDYRIASAVDLPFQDAAFDFAVATMSFMDIPEIENVFSETFRVLKPAGCLQFSITHPCFDTPHRRNLRDAGGKTYAIEVGDYFRHLDGDVSEWTFSAAPAEIRQGMRKFRIPRFTRTISEWMNLVVDSGFRIERIAEPRPDDDAVRAHPDLQDAQVVAYFLHIRARKPA
jgi:ubiquinone/menaquinone biosynthesis C-methylase UbiE